MTLVLLAVPLLPLLAGLIIILLKQRFRIAGGMLLMVVTACSLVFLILLYDQNFMLQATWFETGGMVLTIGLQLNDLTWFGALLVTAIALPVALYSVGYMSDEVQRPRFFAQLALFIGAMLTLVLADSLLLMFAAWEAVGVASYLLIRFHHQEERAAAAAAKAFLMTRIGDVGFLIAWLLVFVELGTTGIDSLLNAVATGTLDPGLTTLLALLFFSASIGKSAQLPLSLWLPDAMIAPTPVSALLHSATMVAAGVYLLLRFYPLFAAAPLALDVIFGIGFATAAIAALFATAEMDLKRILAWSTISQLGEMMVAVGLGAPLAAALHLMAHACFKSTLFMAAGVVDKYAGTRDLDQIGGLRRALPVTTLCFLIGALSLAGIQPFFTETSHDAIFAAALHAGPLQAAGVLALLLMAGIYIGRAGVAVFAGEPRSPKAERGKVQWSMQAGMVVTAIASALITLIIMVLPGLLPFQAGAEASSGGRISTVLAGITGLAIGGMIAWHRGPVPVFGRFPDTLQNALTAVTRMPLHMTLRIVNALQWVEQRLDACVRTLASKVFNPDRIERWLDAATRRLTHATWAIAHGSEQAEQSGFGAGGDYLARRLRMGGERLHALQSGKLYLYTLGLFVWTLLVMLAAGLVLW